MNPVRKAQLLSFLGSGLMRLLMATLRFRIVDEVGVLPGRPDQPMIWVFWHNRLFVMPYVFNRFLPRANGAALTSASKDGEILAAFLRRFGLLVVRGSSSRGGARALIEMRRIVATGSAMAITPDGPRGPCYELSPGVVRLAQISGAPVLPVHVRYERCWQLKSWDRFMIPKPFSRVEVRFGPFHPVAATEDEEQFEVERLKLEQVLRDGVDKAPGPGLAAGRAG